MNFANLFIVVMLVYYTVYIIKVLFNKKGRLKIQVTNEDLDKKRKIPIKTVKEQKEFLNLKYPKRNKKFKFTWKLLLNIILQIILFVFIFKFYTFLFFKFDINLKIWQALLIIIIFPISLNFILGKFNLQKGDLRVFLR